MLKLNDSIWGFGTTQVLGSAVSGPLGAVTFTGESTVEGDTPQDMEAFGAPGIVFRPRAPEMVTGEDGAPVEVGAEAQTVQMGDRVVPLAMRDLRFNKAFPAPKSGTVALVGYAGGYVSFDDIDTSTGKASMLTAYVPYDFDSDGIPRKAMAIIADPDQESIALVHGDGAAVLLGTDGITARADSSTWFSLGPGKFSVTADQIQLRGVCSLGASAEAAGLNAAGVTPASPATPVLCPSVYLSTV